jgi:hypothetical protein
MRPMVALVLAAVMLFCGAGSSVDAIAPAASSGQEPYLVYGPGNVSCGHWTSEHHQYHSLQALSMDSWVLGFLSGAEWAHTQMAGTESDAIKAWIDNYCATNPLDKLSTATASLSYELEQRAK